MYFLCVLDIVHVIKIFLEKHGHFSGAEEVLLYFGRMYQQLGMQKNKKKSKRT